MACAENTQIFNFNLNEMNVSTPLRKRSDGPPQSPTGDPLNSSRKQLFMAPEKKLSTIMEETRSYSSSTTSGSMGNTAIPKPQHLSSIVEEQGPSDSSYNFNLEQNMKANAALRSSLFGGEFLDCEAIPQPVLVRIQTTIIKTCKFTCN